jgi:hypothetical protein
VCYEGAIEADDGSIVRVDIEGEEAVSPARPQLEARTRMARNHGSR